MSHTCNNCGQEINDWGRVCPWCNAEQPGLSDLFALGPKGCLIVLGVVCWLGFLLVSYDPDRTNSGETPPPQSKPGVVSPQSKPGVVSQQSDPVFVPPQGYPVFVPPQGYPVFVPPQAYPVFVPPQGYPVPPSVPTPTPVPTPTLVPTPTPVPVPTPEPLLARYIAASDQQLDARLKPYIERKSILRIDSSGKGVDLAYIWVDERWWATNNIQARQELCRVLYVVLLRQKKEPCPSPDVRFIRFYAPGKGEISVCKYLEVGSSVLLTDR